MMGPIPGGTPGTIPTPEVPMKAIAVYPSQKQIKLIDAPLPSIQGPTEVKLQMLDIGDRKSVV